MTMAEVERVEVRGADAMRALGERVASLLQAGDLVVLSGPLGAGKTTFVQGVAAGMRVRGPITSPTFVIARIHPALGRGPDLVHVDAYRLSTLADVDDLDLDTSMEDSVTVVEWGAGLVEPLGNSPRTVEIERDPDQPDDVRVVRLVGFTPREAPSPPD